MNRQCISDLFDAIIDNVRRVYSIEPRLSFYNDLNDNEQYLLRAASRKVRDQLSFINVYTEEEEVKKAVDDLCVELYKYEKLDGAISIPIIEMMPINLKHSL